VQSTGSDLPAGAVALPAGRVLDPGALGLAASLGRSQLLVHRRPRVAILATGDELSPVDRPLEPNQLPDSNSHALAAACLDAGAAPLLLPIAGDRIEALQAGIEAARGSDLLVTSGGVSVGAKDLVRAALRRAGARLHLWRVAVRPGKPLAFGLWGRTAVFGLPGNPASALVTFELFVRPALRALAGLPGSGRTMITGRLAAPIDKPPGLTVYLRTRAHQRGGDLWLAALPTQRSGHATSITGFEALAVLPQGATHLGKGARVEAILLAPPGAFTDNPLRSDR
jgi:molybdopterin molybdotransferase